MGGLHREAYQVVVGLDDFGKLMLMCLHDQFFNDNSFKIIIIKDALTFSL